MNYLEKNTAWWDDKVDAHLKSEMYKLDKWKQGETSLNEIELDLLGDVRGKRILHLQCHFGQDSLSLQRMGAQVTGVDLSSQAIRRAQELNKELSLETSFVQSDILQLMNYDLGLFDLVYASYGVIGWHPDPKPWMDIAQHFTRPGGRFLYVEFHPAMWMYNDEFTEVKYGYFNSGPIIETSTESYASEGKTQELEDITWNHSLSDIYNAMQSAGYTIDHFKEYDFSPYNIIKSSSQKGKRFYVSGLEGKLPLTGFK